MMFIINKFSVINKKILLKKLKNSKKIKIILKKYKLTFKKNN